MLIAIMLQAAVPMLPGDHGPLPLAAMLSAPENGPPPPLDTTPALSSEAAEKAMRGAVARCLVEGVRIAVAVVDAHGGLRAALAANGAAPDHVFIAARKATAAAAFGEPTSQVQAFLRSDPAAVIRLKPYMAVTPGAVPFRVAGRIVGAIGASGGTGTQDEDCAEAGAVAVTVEKRQ